MDRNRLGDLCGNVAGNGVEIKAFDWPEARVKQNSFDLIWYGRFLVQHIGNYKLSAIGHREPVTAGSFMVMNRAE